MKLNFGKKTINFEFSKRNILGILNYVKQKVRPLKKILTETILDPIGKPRLTDLLRKNKPGDIVVLVSDITRSISDYPAILSFLVGEIVDAGIDEKNIEFMVTLGTHRKHTTEENRVLYGDLTSDFRFSFHDCYNDLVSIGKTSTGLQVEVNRRVREADFVIATGRINFHYLAGFSGGRKSVLPGISSYKTIRNNHCKLKRDGVAMGNVTSNIIAQEMDEAAHLFGIDYLVNVIETPDKHIASAVCGDMVHAYKKGVEDFKKERLSKISRKADCVIVSAGGYPKDRTFFNGHKALNHATSAVRKGGSIILIAECADGIGNEEFRRYMLGNNIGDLLNYPETKIEVGGHRAFQTSRIIKDYKIYIISNLDAELLRQMKFTPVKDIDSAMDLVKKDHGQDLKVYVVPDGRSVLALVNGKV